MDSERMNEMAQEKGYNEMLDFSGNHKLQLPIPTNQLSELDHYDQIATIHNFENFLSSV